MKWEMVEPIWLERASLDTVSPIEEDPQEEDDNLHHDDGDEKKDDNVDDNIVLALACHQGVKNGHK